MSLLQSSEKNRHEEKKNQFNENKKVTHLYHQDRFLKAVPIFSPQKDVCVLYLFNNDIEVIENLGDNIFPNLSSLYLQNNKIKKMVTIPLKNLRKLYIGYNQIAVIEGLEQANSLEELHVEKQALPDGMDLCFDPRSALNLSRTLRVLNISNNKIASFSSLSFLKELQSIDASNCNIENLKEVCQTIKDWKYLTVAKFYGNPISKNYRYREDIIAHSFYLESLDGKDISDFSRDFLKRLETRRLLVGRYAVTSVNLASIVDDLPKNYPPGLQKAASAQLIKGRKYNPLESSVIKNTEMKEFIAWRGMPKRRPFVKRTNVNKVKIMETPIIINKFS